MMTSSTQRFICGTIVLGMLLLLRGFESQVFAQPRPAPADDPFGNNIHGKLSRGEMEDMLYGSLGGSRQAFRRMRRDTIQRYIDRIDNVCKLSDEQKNKIDQSIEIDIARTESKVASLLSEIQDSTPGAKKNAVYNEAWKSIHTIQREQANDASSLWRKVLKSSLTAEQNAKLEDDQKRILAREAEAKKMRLILLTQRKLGMHLAQRRAFSDFLFRPENNSVLTLSDIKNAIGKLSDTERKSLMTETQLSSLNAMGERLPPVPGDDPFGL
ncbi:MAG: hypothetical protein ACK56W_18790 [Pirellula sp.]|jgi:hypothetical protein|nr:hypothetical protein [Pirellula sp.]